MTAARCDYCFSAAGYKDPYLLTNLKDAGNRLQVPEHHVVSLCTSQSQAPKVGTLYPQNPHCVARDGVERNDGVTETEGHTHRQRMRL